MRLQILACILSCLCAASAVGRHGVLAAQTPGGDAARTALDEILDVNVRDGMVYYRALKAERSRLDRYVASLGPVAIDRAPRDEQIAFWINAYNAVVLQTVVEHYPIVERTRDYPQKSIRQIPGAFERVQHRIAGRMVTLDQIEQTILPPFHDPRVYFALGRAAIGSGRLRSEAYAPAMLEKQLSDAATECANRSQCVQIDQAQNTSRVSSIFSWRATDFVAAYADAAPPAFATRSSIERAVIGFIGPRLLPNERAFLATNAFKVEYIPFDWTLNDLTGRGGR